MKYILRSRINENSIHDSFGQPDYAYPLRLLCHPPILYSGDFDFSKPIKYPRLLAAAGVTQILRLQDEKAPDAAFHAEPVAGALPRAYIVHGVRAARDTAQTLGAIATGELNLASEVFLASPPPGLEMNAAPAAPDETVRILRYAPEDVEIEATLNRPGVLVLLDADFPGWVARVDGQRAPIFAANYLFRGLILAKGTHRVSFRYEPRSFPAGLAGGAVGAAGLAGLIALAWIRRRKVLP